MSENPLAQPPVKAPAAPETPPPAPDAAPATPAPAVSDAAAFHTMFDDSGAFKEGAWDSFPVIEGEDISKFQKLGAKTPDLQTLVRNTVQLENMLSNDKLPLPKPGDGPEAWDRVHDALGRPEEAKYVLPDGLEMPEDQQAPIDAVFHKAGVSQRQADSMYQDIAQIMQGQIASDGDAQSAQVEAAVASLEAEVGPRNTEAYSAALRKADVVAEHLGLNDSAFFETPGFAAKLASMHDTLIDSKVKGDPNSTISQSQGAQAIIDSIQNNPQDPRYADYRRSDWNNTHQYVMDLMDQIAASKVAEG